MTELCLSSVLWASKTLASAAPDMNHVAERLKLCLPMPQGGCPPNPCVDIGSSLSVVRVFETARGAN